MMDVEKSPDWLEELLKEVQLEKFLCPIRDELQITQLSHFDHVDEKDLKGIGMSRPSYRRLFDAIKKKKASTDSSGEPSPKRRKIEEHNPAEHETDESSLVFQGNPRH
ncbi:activated Cdc42 kinase Ack-like, partial [Saccoglossus kowalevskii]